MKPVRHLLRWTALLAIALAASAQAAPDTIRIGVATAGGGDPVTSVSYTHLTLPTKA